METNMDVYKKIWEFQKALLNWYDFHNEGKVLYIADRKSSMVEMLQEKCSEVLCVDSRVSLQEKFLCQYEETFKYIIIIDMIERLSDPIKSLTLWKNLLSDGGRLLLGMDNRLGLRYFCGDRDPFTNRNFDGIENYRRVMISDRKNLNGCNYSKEEICNILDAAGWNHRKFYSVLPNLDLPQLIYAEDYLPAEELAIRLFPMYRNPDSVFLEEEFLYTDLIKNGMFHVMANSFLIECSKDNTFENVKHVTISMDRGRENAMATIIRQDRNHSGLDNGTVEKRVLYDEGKDKLQTLKKNAEDLRAHGLNVLEAEIQGNSYIMPYVDSEILMNYLRGLAKTNLDRFKEEIDKFRDLILQSSEHVSLQDGNEDKGIILKKGYLDLVPLNCFYDNGEYIFYDQEFYEENYPANTIILRAIDIIYSGDAKMESMLPRKYFYKKYGLEEHLELWRRMAAEFTIKLRNQRELRSFHEKFQRNYDIIHTNRQRMNYSAAEYQRIFVDIFRNVENKKVILFGSGNFTKRFLAQFKKQYSVYAIVDNNSSRWGTKLEGIVILPPKSVAEIPEQERRIIICVKNYVAIVNQLQNMGIKDYCIYDKNVEYPRKQESFPAVIKNIDSKLKKYNIGYIAGVFDLFHIGHLNMFKRAKEQCNYLIVGVVTDEGVRKYKKTEPVIPFDERLELIRCCKYVDEAVEIPLNYAGTRDAYQMYHFDCQFSGSDYMDNPDWLGDKVFLEKQGADLVFFPYTEGTSSTKIKGIIEKALC